MILEVSMFKLRNDYYGSLFFFVVFLWCNSFFCFYYLEIECVCGVVSGGYLLKDVWCMYFVD